MRTLQPHFVVTTVSDAIAALILTEGGVVFDAILCAHEIGEISGRVYHDALARRSPSQAQRVVILSGTEPDPDDVFAAFLGPDRYFLKPWSSSALAGGLVRIARPRVSPRAPLVAA